MVPNLADNSTVVRITAITLLGQAGASVANTSSKAVQERMTLRRFGVKEDDDISKILSL